MDKKTLLGMMLIVLIFMLFNQLVWKKPKPASAQPATAQTADTLKTEADTLKTVLAPPELVEPDMKTAPVNENIILENDSLKLVLSSLGGVIRSVYLKHHELDDGSKVQLIPEGGNAANTILLTDSSSQDLKNVPFEHELTTLDGRPAVRFSFTPEPDRTIEKTYGLDRNYGVKFRLKVHYVYGLTGYTLDFGSGIRDTEKSVKGKVQDYRFIGSIQNTLVRESLGKLMKKSVSQQGNVDWAASQSKYFVIACREGEPLLLNSAQATVANASPAFTLTAKGGSSTTDLEHNLSLYFGPADHKLLKTYGGGMEKIAERGANWLRWLVNIFAWFLNLLYKLIGNYGIAIIIFSLTVKIVLHPLTHKSMDSSLRMQRIQPQVQAIQQQYKSDPKQMQMELSKLYKEAGASPLGGCLPLLLQMPVFFALYTVLRFSLDMRQAPFFGWIRDLSEPDPYYILPILMGVFMIVQSLMMSPKKQQLQQMDEKQQAMQSSQKMMTWIMPVVLFFVFRSMPAGLVLYWTVFNILSIIQQYYLQKHLHNKETA